MFAGAAAQASEGSYCDPEVSECAPTPTPTPAPKPSLPTTTVTSSGSYFIELGSVWNFTTQQGQLTNGKYWYYGSGPTLLDASPDGSLTVNGAYNYTKGDYDTSIKLVPVTSPLGSAEVIARAEEDDPGVPVSLAARGSAGVQYLVQLHAKDQATADALSALLTTSGSIASISGSWSLSGTGSYWGSVVARTGMPELSGSLGGLFYQACSPINYMGTPDQCGSGTYTIPLNFVSGSTYAGGSSRDFYSLIDLSASANAGPVNLGYYTGTADAFIDPTINFAPGIDLSKLGVNVGTNVSYGTVSGVPEPASWATMLLGMFGAGIALRSRRRRVAMA
jgi:hypothetical protein